MKSTLLEDIVNIFTQSTFAYRNYLAGGKTFRFAQELKLFNGAALKLMTENKVYLPEELQKDTDALIIHYTEWSKKWEALANEKVHQPNDVFVFPNDISFPKEAAQHFEAAYERMNPPPANPAS